MILDVIFIIVLLAAAFFGAKEGCVKVITKLVALIAAFVLAYMFAKTAGNYIENNTWIGEKVKDIIQVNVEQHTNNEQQGITIIQDMLNKFGVNATDLLSSKINGYVFTGIGFIAVYIIVRLILWVASIMLDGVFELPILKSFNKLGGMLVYIIIALIETSVILAVIKFMGTFISSLTEI